MRMRRQAGTSTEKEQRALFEEQEIRLKANSITKGRSKKEKKKYLKKKMHSYIAQPTTCQGITRGRWLPKGTGTDSVAVKVASILLYTKLVLIRCSTAS